MAKRKAAKAVKAAKMKAIKAAKAENVRPEGNAADMKLAVAILVFGLATAFSAIYKMGSQITILLGLVTAAAALAIALKNK